jgi:hypothetical protein
MPGTNPLPCSHSVMAQRGAGSGTVLLLNTGNYPGESNFLNETVTWNGSNWTVVSTSQIDPNGPFPLRSNHAMAYDGTNIVLFGGQGQSETDGVLSDTWTWNGTVWAKKAPGTVPFGRTRHDLATVAGGAIMFGGTNVLNVLNETWFWNGSNWSLLPVGTSPPARMDFAMASTGTVVLMYGGKTTGNSSFGDTWTFTGGAGGNWTKQTPAVSPPALSGACMAYDNANSQFVLFGGADDEGILNPQTWIWTGGAGGNWHLVTPAVTPAARLFPQMSYDGTRVVMFGGYGLGADQVFGETWAWSGGLGGNWVQL